MNNLVPKWLNQLTLLLWKNTKLQSRSWISTSLEILVPAIFAIILLPIRTIVNSDRYLNDTVYPSFETNDFPDSLVPSVFYYEDNIFKLNKLENAWQWQFAYQPNNSLKIDKIMENVAKKLNLRLTCKLKNASIKKIFVFDFY
jgi:hypothetical protein